MPNNGFFWSEESKQDLLVMPRENFLVKYPKVTGHAYRQKLGEVRRAVEMVAPIEMEDDGLYRPAEWVYTPASGVIPTDAERHIMIGDTHGYFVDQQVWAAVLDFVRFWKPHQINLLGDIIDAYDISRYSKNPNRRAVLGQEIDFTREVILAELRRAAPKARILWTAGNHEARLQSYLWNRAPELASLPGLDMRALFRLPALKIQYIEEPIVVGDIMLTHGHMARKHSGWTAKAMLEEMGQSIVHNHTHRLGAIYKTDRSGDYVAFENGCLCKMDPEYIKGVPNWQHGFSCGWVLPNGRFHLQQVSIVHGKFVFDGRFFGAAEPLDHCHD